MKKIIYIYGGPGSGKSTFAAGLFYKLKLSGGVTAEMNLEPIKDWVWEGRNLNQGSQMLLLGEFYNREKSYIDSGIDFIITDCPPLLSDYYGNRGEFVYPKGIGIPHDYYEGYEIIHMFVKRDKEYNPKGRYQSEEDAKLIDGEIKELLLNSKINFLELSQNDFVISRLVDRLIKGQCLTNLSW